MTTTDTTDSLAPAASEAPAASPASSAPLSPSASLAPAVREVVRDIQVAPDQLKAVVRGEELHADTPRDMRRLLAETVYNVFHSGRVDGHVPSRLRDRALEARLREAVPHSTITVPARVRGGPERNADGVRRLLVEREGIRFWAPESAVGAWEGAEPGEVIDLVMPSSRPALSPGFFLVDGSRQRRRQGDVLRVYVHVEDTESVVHVWGTALTFLEEREIPYRAKVLSTPELYARRDAVVVYLDDDFAPVAPELADALAPLPGLAAGVSSFTEELRPGIATAWEPTDTHPGRQGLSFGQHRATVLAAAMVEAAEDPSRAEELVAAHFVDAAIDPSGPAKNLAS